MEDQELRKLIESLHAEIQNTHTVDEKSQELLAHLESDIRKLLAQTGAVTAPVHPSTLRRMQEGLDQFEVTHPTLTILISKLMEALSNVGI
jgi:flagellar biosynthesis/type III secretory pathway protein FliH